MNKKRSSVILEETSSFGTDSSMVSSMKGSQKKKSKLKKPKKG